MTLKPKLPTVPTVPKGLTCVGVCDALRAARVDRFDEWAARFIAERARENAKKHRATPKALTGREVFETSAQVSVPPAPSRPLLAPLNHLPNTLHLFCDAAKASPTS